MASLIGGRWRVVRPLGEGGQGHLFIVEDNQGQFTGQCALKRLKNSDRLKRFEREVLAVKRLTHPGIPPIIDYSLVDVPYFVSPFCGERTISDIAPLAPLDALDLIDRICEIVEYAHAVGIVHRDLKPTNIVIDDDQAPHLIDFGLCYTDDSERLTETAEQVGSRYFIAPEMEDGPAVKVAPAVDVYSLGKVLYYLLTKRVFAREDFLGERDLVQLTGNEQLDYVTHRILRRTIAVDPAMRLSVRALRSEVRSIRRLIHEHFYPGREGSRCRFCGEGHYAALPKHTLNNTSTPGRTGPLAWEVVRCDRCGHFAWFQP